MCTALLVVAHPLVESSKVVLAAAKPWTYWISFVLVASALLAILAVIVGYLIKVTSARYPKQ